MRPPLRRRQQVQTKKEDLAALKSLRRDAPSFGTSWQIFIDHVLWIGIVEVGLHGPASIAVAVGRIGASRTGPSRIGGGAWVVTLNTRIGVGPEIAARVAPGIAADIARNPRFAGRASVALRTRTGRGACAALSTRTAAALSSPAAGACASTRGAAASAPGTAAGPSAATSLGKYGRAQEQAGYECQSKPSSNEHTRTLCADIVLTQSSTARIRSCVILSIGGTGEMTQ